MTYAYDFERPIVQLEDRLDELKSSPSADDAEIADEIRQLEEQLAKVKERIYSRLTPWQRVQLARHPARPRVLDYTERLFTEVAMLAGDRSFADDHAVVGGLARFRERSVVFVGTQKGRNTRENIDRHFGMAHPEGYRKAQRLARLAARFGLPLVQFVDTPGANAGIGAEERGQGWAIAESLALLSVLPARIVSVNIGEGGSGGALALGVADRILMMENAYYSVITPEGCASILFKDATRAPEAAEALRLTAEDLLGLDLIHEIIEEPLGGAHRDPKISIEVVGDVLARTLAELDTHPLDYLVAARYEWWRSRGVVEED